MLLGRRQQQTNIYFLFIEILPDKGRRYTLCIFHYFQSCSRYLQQLLFAAFQGSQFIKAKQIFDKWAAIMTIPPSFLDALSAYPLLDPLSSQPYVAQSKIIDSIQVYWYSF